MPKRRSGISSLLAGTASHMLFSSIMAFQSLLHEDEFLCELFTVELEYHQIHSSLQCLCSLHAYLRSSAANGESLSR
jgi:hypothetical protein